MKRILALLFLGAVALVVAFGLLARPAGAREAHRSDPPRPTEGAGKLVEPPAVPRDPTRPRARPADHGSQRRAGRPEGHPDGPRRDRPSETEHRPDRAHPAAHKEQPKAEEGRKGHQADQRRAQSASPKGGSWVAPRHRHEDAGRRAAPAPPDSGHGPHGSRVAGSRHPRPMTGTAGSRVGRPRHRQATQRAVAPRRRPTHRPTRTGPGLRLRHHRPRPPPPAAPSPAAPPPAAPPAAAPPPTAPPPSPSARTSGVVQPCPCGGTRRSAPAARRSPACASSTPRAGPATSTARARDSVWLRVRRTPR